jgi:hypothetical protein
VIEILLGLCYTLFGVTLGLQLGTAISPQFDWTGAGNRGFLRLFAEKRLDFWNIMELWYGIGIFLYLGTSVMFLCLFTVLYFRISDDSAKMSFAHLFRETGLMVVAALFPFFAFHLTRLFLSTIPMVDPEMIRQLEHLRRTNIATADWAFRSVGLPVLAEQLVTLSLSYLLGYLVLLEIFSNMQLTRRVWKTLRRLANDSVTFVKWLQRRITGNHAIVHL